ncbi:hypothetical protein CGLO_12408 [Colletotrichum gloeosporioides Cg-14]|uniref:BTB domain-containing protein n=1 Tax=Colletotrichum gloeosporioides (strain Cg-14) TaxID=1237896 RepID=T0L9P7_COLGC|nr:hypothetical protein CGLO_12408 [Colletotrichum gloeosporioides Cg-14]
MHHEEVHQLDPDGDVELILRNPNAPFAVWDESEDAVVQHLSACDQRLSIKARYASYFLDWFGNMKHVSTFPLELLNIDNPFDVDGFGEPVLCRFLLSSRHLMLASSIFNKQLSGPWKESHKDPVERMRRINTTEWHLDALLILFQIIHGKNSHVPRFVDLEMLSKIATLVDYYDCHEAVQLYGDIWIDGIKDNIPNQCNRELVLWMLVSWVFSKEKIFNQVTRTAILDSKGPVPTLGLPIPQFIIGESRYVRSLLSFKIFLTHYATAQYSDFIAYLSFPKVVKLYFWGHLQKSSL